MPNWFRSNCDRFSRTFFLKKDYYSQQTKFHKKFENREHLIIDIFGLRKTVKKKYRQMGYEEAKAERLYTKK